MVVPMRQWLRRIFSSGSAEDEAAEHEEYGAPEPVTPEPERSFFAGAEATEAAQEELEELEPPPDPAP
jgi:hypothetical protein